MFHTDQEYYDEVKRILASKGLHFHIDRDTVLNDKHDGLTPEQCAQAFEEEYA